MSLSPRMPASRCSVVELQSILQDLRGNISCVFNCRFSPTELAPPKDHGKRHATLPDSLLSSSQKNPHFVLLECLTDVMIPMVKELSCLVVYMTVSIQNMMFLYGGMKSFWNIRGNYLPNHDSYCLHDFSRNAQSRAKAADPDVPISHSSFMSSYSLFGT